MSSQEYQHPIYQIPNDPSQQLKVVLEYLDNLKRWDFDALNKLSTSDFTQQILPSSLGLLPRTKNECTEYLHTFRDSLNSAPLEVRNAQTLVSPLVFDCKERLSYTKLTRVRVKFGSTYVPSITLAPRARATVLIPYRHCFAPALVQMFVKPVNIEGIFNFTFGTGKDENLIVDLTEFLDSKVYAGGDK
jgi:hypothetical protein